MIPRPFIYYALAVALALPGPAGAAADVRDDANAKTAEPRASPSPEEFREGLSPYGQWVESPRYGRVWRPRVSGDWRPYYHGHWAWTDSGWFWVSDEPWGWATYHYGRWAFEAGFGWVWIPGYEWAPAWVSWRFGAGVIGWAPLFPGFSIFAVTPPTFVFAFTFVPVVRFVGFPVFNFAFAPSLVSRFFPITRAAPPRLAIGGFRTPSWGGPPRGFVEQRIGRSIAPARIAWGAGGRATLSGGRMTAPHAFRGGAGPMPRGGAFGGRGPAAPRRGFMTPPRAGGFRGGFAPPRGGGPVGAGARPGGGSRHS